MGGLAVVHEEIITRTYCAPRCSVAYLWKIFAFLASLIIPLLICIVTQGLWKKTNTYLEQPRIEYAHKSFFLVADSSNATAYCFWSSYQELNDADSDHLVMPIIESQEIDRDNDGKADEILISATLHTQNLTFPVNNVFFYLLFNVNLEYRSVYKMELPIMGYIEHLTEAPEVSIFGDMRVKSTEPLPSHGWFDISERIPEPEDGTTLFGNGTDAAEVDASLIQLFPLDLLPS
uniref:Transmembrane protein 231 n=1 Tax=Panagrellus redivivus TaxID=6233 RepID=A0A7E4W1A1_PANRE